MAIRGFVKNVMREMYQHFYAKDVENLNNILVKILPRLTGLYTLRLPYGRLGLRETPVGRGLLSCGKLSPGTSFMASRYATVRQPCPLLRKVLIRAVEPSYTTKR